MAKSPWEIAAGPSEFSHQAALFAWANCAAFFGFNAANDRTSYITPGYAKMAMDQQADKTGKYDRLTRLKWLYANKNQGHGDVVRGARSKAEGVKPGVSDVFLPVVMSHDDFEPPFEGGHRLNVYGNGEHRYAGLYLELKKPGKHKISPEQLDFQADMRGAGYACEIAVGWEAARDIIVKYLGK